MDHSSRSFDPAQSTLSRQALEVENLVKRFDLIDDVLTAVDDVSFKVAPGEFVSVIGPSGCGKSTLLNIIAGLTEATSGRVSVDGAISSGPNPAVGVVFQEESTFPWRTVLENVAFPLEVLGVPKTERIDRARHFVDLVGLAGFERLYPAALSGGMRQRVAMIERLLEENEPMATYPWIDGVVREAQEFMGKDFWPYGLAENRKTIDAFLRYHHSQGLSSRRLDPEEIFVPSTLSRSRI